jgi:acyl-coenzyme A synthetase/AMP-(fatty) acid ligase
VADRNRLGHLRQLHGLHQFPVKEGSPTKPAPGWNLQVLDPETQEQVKTGDIGALVVKLPLPPGTLPTLWQNDKRYIESYLDEFPGYYKTADAGFIDEDGYAYIMSRTDDIINVAGHRLSTGAWRRCWPIIPMWPSAPFWASTTSSRARCRRLHGA